MLTVSFTGFEKKRAKRICHSYRERDSLGNIYLPSFRQLTCTLSVSLCPFYRLASSSSRYSWECFPSYKAACSLGQISIANSSWAILTLHPSLAHPTGWTSRAKSLTYLLESSLKVSNRNKYLDRSRCAVGVCYITPFLVERNLGLKLGPFLLFLDSHDILLGCRPGRDEVRVSRNRVPYPCRKTKLRDRVGSK